MPPPLHAADTCNLVEIHCHAVAATAINAEGPGIPLPHSAAAMARPPAPVRVKIEPPTSQPRTAPPAPNSNAPASPVAPTSSCVSATAAQHAIAETGALRTRPRLIPPQSRLKHTDPCILFGGGACFLLAVGLLLGGLLVMPADVAPTSAALYTSAAHEWSQRGLQRWSDATPSNWTVLGRQGNRTLGPAIAQQVLAPNQPPVAGAGSSSAPADGSLRFRTPTHGALGADLPSRPTPPTEHGVHVLGSADLELSGPDGTPSVLLPNTPLLLAWTHPAPHGDGAPCEDGSASSNGLCTTWYALQRACLALRQEADEAAFAVAVGCIVRCPCCALLTFPNNVTRCTPPPAQAADAQDEGLLRAVESLGMRGGGGVQALHRPADAGHVWAWEFAPRANASTPLRTQVQVVIRSADDPYVAALELTNGALTLEAPETPPAWARGNLLLSGLGAILLLVLAWACLRSWLCFPPDQHAKEHASPLPSPFSLEQGDVELAAGSAGGLPSDKPAPRLGKMWLRPPLPDARLSPVLERGAGSPASIASSTATSVAEGAALLRGSRTGRGIYAPKPRRSKTPPGSPAV